eukprot:851889-Amphidinium_carterae.3
MDPTPEQVETMSSIVDVAEWLGILDAVRDSLLSTLGAEPDMHPRIIAVIPDTDFQTVVEAWDPNGQKPTLAKRSMGTLLARACRLACKRDPDGAAAAQLATPSVCPSSADASS